MDVNILGTNYKISVKKYTDDAAFERNGLSGYCNGFEKEIVVCDMSSHPDWDCEGAKSIEQCQKQTIRHEIVHAFFNESGLMDSAGVYDRAWAKNEEMVDWISLQGPKIYKAWKESDAL